MESRQYKCPECKRRFYDLPLQNQGTQSGGAWLCLFELLYWITAAYLSVIAVFAVLGIGSVSLISKSRKTCPFCGTRSMHRVKGTGKEKG